MAGLLWSIIVILVVVWVILFLIAHVAGGFIHILLLIALILLIWNLLAGRGARV
ncbi:MAG: lmo0937 family membrane protein [Candidatus Tyrphobacter sp.]